MSFSSIIARVETVLIDLPSDVVTLIPDFVRDGQRKLEDKHGFRVMETVAEYVTQTGVRYLGARPDRYRSALDYPSVTFGDASSQPLKWIEREQEITELYNVDDEALYDLNHPHADPQHSTHVGLGQPRHILDIDTGFNVYPLPDGQSVGVGDVSSPPIYLYTDGQYRIKIPFLQRQAKLMTGSAEENWFTLNAEEYLIDYASTEGFLLNRNNAEHLKWNARTILEQRRVVYQDKRSRMTRDMRLRPNPQLLSRSSRRAGRWF